MQGCRTLGDCPLAQLAVDALGLADVCESLAMVMLGQCGSGPPHRMNSMEPRQPYRRHAV